jgi:hypothetical protein
MATGAGEQYWEERALPSVFKHDLLRRYLPQFAGKTGSEACLGCHVAFASGFSNCVRPYDTRQ